MNGPWLAADPVLPAPLLYAILVALTSCFIWLEWKRNAAYFPLRVIALVGMMLAVAGFLFRPEYRTTRLEQIILTPPDYDEARTDSLLNAYPTGVIRLSLADNIAQNRVSTIEGVFNNPSGNNSKLILTGPGGKEDSVSLSNNGLQRFKLSFLPKNPGRFLYTLWSDDELVGKIPVSVEEEKQLDILFIQHYPTFETRSLKEFLARNHRLLLRYQLSRNKFRFESINRKAARINLLTREVLSEFDLLIIDTDALNSLRASEKNSLRSAIDEGLGVLPFLNSPPVSRNEFFPFTFKSVASDTVHTLLSGDDANILPAWPFDPIREDAIRPILKNQNRVLSGYRDQGFGKIGFQLIQETYRLMLQGDSLAYATLWSTVVERISRSGVEPSTVWQQQPNFPLYPDAPAIIEMISSEDVPEVFLNDVEIPVEENVLMDDLWNTKFWTDAEGWNYITVAGDTVLDIYTSNKQEWQSLAAANALQNTLRAASSRQLEKKSEEIFLPVPVWIFYLLFLTGAGFLWVAPKL